MFYEPSYLIPTLAPAVQTVWNECGTYIESTNCSAMEGEVEFFVEKLIEGIALALDMSDGSITTREFLIHSGFIKKD